MYLLNFYTLLYGAFIYRSTIRRSSTVAIRYRNKTDITLSIGGVFYLLCGKIGYKPPPHKPTSPKEYVGKSGQIILFFTVYCYLH